MNNELYWDDLYTRGGTSGKGSIGEIAKWKWKIIRKYIGNLDTVLDVGCGDLSFWHENSCLNYTGIDISPYIIEKNKKRYPNWKFICSPAQIRVPEIKSPVVFCFDVLFHIINEKQFQKILKNLILYSNRWILIHTWNKNPLYSWSNRIIWLKTIQLNKLILSLLHRLETDNRYQIYRNFHKNIPLFEKNNFNLIKIEINEQVNPYGALFVFKKEEDKSSQF